MNYQMMRELGRSGIKISAMGLGCWAIGGPFWAGDRAAGWGAVDDDESIRAIHAGIDHGITFFDTADVYGAGHSEWVLGRALQGRRDQVVIATKFGLTFEGLTRQITGSDTSAAYIKRACEASLRRLDTDYIDLYQFHLNDFDLGKAAAVRDTLETLVVEGKIRYYGWSTDYLDRAQLFAEGEHCTTIQFQMNVLDDAPEMVVFCERANLAGINRGPLAMGLLTGKYARPTELGADDVRGENSPDWMKYFENGRPSPAWHDKVRAVRDILTSDGRTLAQGALAWLWARSPNTIPIPGFRTADQVEENSAAMAHGPLQFDQMVEIDALLERAA